MALAYPGVFPKLRQILYQAASLLRGVYTGGDEACEFDLQTLLLPLVVTLFDHSVNVGSGKPFELFRDLLAPLFNPFGTTNTTRKLPSHWELPLLMSPETLAANKAGEGLGAS